MIHFNNPTGIAALVLGGLCATQGGRILDGFLKAGGVATAIRLLEESTCPNTLVFTVALIEGLVDPSVSPSGGAGRPPKLAELLLKSGEWGIMVRCGRGQGETTYLNRFPCQSPGARM